MTTQPRSGARVPGLVWIVLGVALLSTLVGLVMGCGSGPGVTQATAVLLATVRVSGSEGKTTIVSASFVPEAPATLTCPSGATLSVSEADGGDGASATPRLDMGGLQVDTPMVINSTGTTAVTLSSSTSGSVFTLSDGYDHSLTFKSLSLEFQNRGLADTNLPTTARLVVPLRGALRSLAELRVEGAAPDQVGNLAVSFSAGGNVSLTATADANGVLHFTTADTAFVGDLNTASIEFPAESSP